MRYVSTRGASPALGFEEVLLGGLAPDGGLFVPERWPRFGEGELAHLAGLSYPELAARVMAPFVGEALARDEFRALSTEAYRVFAHAAVAPLRQLGTNEWLLELYHGPTLAFKDLALQLVGRLFDHVLARRDERVTVVGATSGDTGSAAIEACRDKPRLRVFILHPKDRISEVQRRQMTTVRAPNIHNVALEGTFDDCQALVKAMFNDATFRAEMRLAAVNSINWARIMAQTVYYVAAALALGAPRREVVFSVPSGNFGDAFAGHVAREMGLPIRRLLVATNRNDILARFFATGLYRKRAVEPSLSPSMDIQVASNFERLIYELCGREGRAVAELMARFAAEGAFTLEPARLAAAKAIYSAKRVDDDATLATIAEVYRQTGELVDPHSATAIAASRALGADDAVPVVTLATAHPAKFPEAVEKATGVRPALPERLADLLARAEEMTVLPNDLEAVKGHLRTKAGEGSATAERVA